MKHKYFYGLSVLFALCCVVSLLGQTTIRLKPSETEAFLGQSVQMDVWIDHAENLGAFQFELIWESHIVHADTAWIGPFLGSTGRTVIPVGPDIDNTGYPGKLAFGSASFGTAPGPDSSGILAHVIFIPKAEGSTTVELKNVVLSDVNGIPIPVDRVVDGLVFVHPYDSTLVTNTNDSGPGSLREAVAYANSHSGPDTLRFQIPASDSGCDSTGVCTIFLTQSLMLTDSGTVIDGYSQPGASPNTNPFGQPINAVLKIVLDGSKMVNSSSPAFDLNGARNVVRGLVISRFCSGIEIVYSNARGNRIQGNFIGTNASGMIARGNRLSSILINYGDENMIGGIDPADRNLISGNMRSGVEIGLSSKNKIQGNYIGTDATGFAPLGNVTGVRIFNVSQNNLIGGEEEGAQNLIAFNRQGVLITGAFGDAFYNTISRNRIHSNTEIGISLESGGNQGLSAPVIQSATGTKVIGTAVPLASIEVFSDQDGQGAIYEGTTTADASGNWALTKSEEFTGPYVTATATDTLGNTSEFSSPVHIETGVESFAEEKIPKAFVLHPAYPNPFNGETLICYELPKEAEVVLSVYNTLGQRIKTLVAERQSAGYYSVHWDGKGESFQVLPSGVYLYCIEAGEFQEMRKMVLVR